MSINLSASDLIQADLVLSELFEETQKWEGLMSAQVELGPGGTAIENLRQSRISFGNPADNLVLLTEETFGDSGVELSRTYQRQIQTQYDFYSMTLAISLRAKPIVQFWRLSCALNFALNGEQQPIVQAIFPKEEWRSVMNIGIGMTLGVNGDLDWSAGVEATQLNQVRDLLPGNFKANAALVNEFKAITVIPSYQYELGYSTIFTSGVGDATCYWRIQDRELQKLGTIKLAIVFKVPKGTPSVRISGLVAAEPNVKWLTADLRDVWSELTERFKDLLRDQEEGATHLVRGDTKEWVLSLPNVAG